MKKNILSIFEKCGSVIEKVANSKSGPFIVSIVAVIALFAIQRDSEIQEAAIQNGIDINKGSQYSDNSDSDDITADAMDDISDEDQSPDIDE